MIDGIQKNVVVQRRHQSDNKWAVIFHAESVHCSVTTISRAYLCNDRQHSAVLIYCIICSLNLRSSTLLKVPSDNPLRHGVLICSPEQNRRSTGAEDQQEITWSSPGFLIHLVRKFYAKNTNRVKFNNKPKNSIKVASLHTCTSFNDRI